MWKWLQNSLFSNVPFLKNLVKKYSGSGMTDAQKEAMTAEQNFNAEQAEQARAWEEQMDNTKYQRKVADLKAAGLNPALAVDGGVSAPTAVSASASTPADPMAEILPTILSMTMQSKQLNLQRDIANREIGLSEKLRNRELDLKERETAVREAELGLKERTTDKVIEQMSANISKLAAETKTEGYKQQLLEVDKRMATANAKQLEAFVSVANDFYKAQIVSMKASTYKSFKEAKLAEEQALAVAVERGFKEGIYTKDFIAAAVDEAIASSKLAKGEVYSQQLDQYRNYVVDCLISGEVPNKFYFTDTDGNQHVFLSQSQYVLESLAKGIGLRGPIEYVTSGSRKDAIHSVSWSNTYRYGSPLRP